MAIRGWPGLRRAEGASALQAGHLREDMILGFCSAMTKT
jgi:hypothetical protein